MTLTVQHERNAGHPWDARPGFDRLYLDADTQVELDEAVQAAERKFWQPWLIGVAVTTRRPGGVLYKPSGAKSPWVDGPDKPHPGFQ